MLTLVHAVDGGSRLLVHPTGTTTLITSTQVETQRSARGGLASCSPQTELCPNLKYQVYPREGWKSGASFKLEGEVLEPQTTRSN